MTPFYAGNRPSSEPPPLYDLYGVVNHYGGILGGHYTSYVRCADAEDSLKSEVGKRVTCGRVYTNYNQYHFYPLLKGKGNTVMVGMSV